MQKPAIGPETAQAVLDHIILHPDEHDQGMFEADVISRWGDSCGTVRCVAGWAKFIHDGSVYDDVHTHGGDIENRARFLLGLSKEDAVKLFYCTGDDEAIEALKYVANSEPIDWDAIDPDISEEYEEQYVEDDRNG